jgi:hypothetical protein
VIGIVIVSLLAAGVAVPTQVASVDPAASVQAGDLGCTPGSAPPQKALIATYHYGRAIGLVRDREAIVIVPRTTLSRSLQPALGGLFLITLGPARDVSDAKRIVAAEDELAQAATDVHLTLEKKKGGDRVIKLGNSVDCRDTNVCAEFSSVMWNPFSRSPQRRPGVFSRLSRGGRYGTWLWIDLDCSEGIGVVVVHVNDLRIAEE